MSEDDKPKLNLRRSLSISDDELLGVVSDSGSQSGRVDPVEQVDSTSDAIAQFDRPSRPSVSHEKASKMPAAGSLLRERGKRTKADLEELWARQNDENSFDLSNDSDIQIGEIGKKFIKDGVQKFRKKMPVRNTVHRPARSKRLNPQTPTTVAPQSNSQPLKLRSSPVSSHDMVSTAYKVPQPAQAQQEQGRGRGRAPFAAIKRGITARPRIAGALMVVALMTAVGVTQLGGDSNGNTAEQDALGASVTSSKTDPDIAAGTGPEIVNKTEFELLYPRGKDESIFETARVSPPDNAAVYAYIDQVQGAELRLSQQAIPPEFKGAEDIKLAEVATDFQATDVIRIDDIIVYHGATERFGGVQSLVFIKDDIMVFISSSKKLSDDEWAAYILSLQ